jgi:hypothetical protein
MSSEPTWPVAPVIKIMSSGPLFEIGFRGEFGVGAAHGEPGVRLADAIGQLTLFGV